MEKSQSSTLSAWVRKLFGDASEEEIVARYEEIVARYEDLVMNEKILSQREEALAKEAEAFYQDQAKLAKIKQELEERETHIVELSRQLNEKKQWLLTVQQKMNEQVITEDQDLADFKAGTLSQLQTQYAETESQLTVLKEEVMVQVQKKKEIETSYQFMVDEVFRYQEQMRKYQEQAAMELTKRTKAVEFSRNKLKSMPSRIKINLQGKETVEVTLSLLLARKNSLFPALISDEVKDSLNKLKNAELFFDVEPEMFKYVMQYLRSGEINWPHTRKELLPYRELTNVLEYFRISDARINFLDDVLAPEVDREMKREAPLSRQLARVSATMLRKQLKISPKKLLDRLSMALLNFNGRIKMVGRSGEQTQAYFVTATDLGYEEYSVLVDSIDRTEVTDHVATDREGRLVPRINHFATGVIDLKYTPLPELTAEYREAYDMPEDFVLERMEVTVDLEDPSYQWVIHWVTENTRYPAVLTVASREYHQVISEEEVAPTEKPHPMLPSH